MLPFLQVVSMYRFQFIFQKRETKEKRDRERKLHNIDI